MRVLVTNDDGVQAPGLHALARSMHGAGHDVQVLAPSREFSGSSAGLGVVTDGARIAVQDVEVPTLTGLVVRAVQAPPALAVRAMCAGGFGWRPEFVVSGVNPGFNTGRLVIHSGTVGAAVTASSFDVRGLAVSTATDSSVGVDTAVVLAVWLVELMRDREPLVANLNVPPVALDALPGVRAGMLSPVGYTDLAWRVERTELEVQRVTREPPFLEGSDAAVLAQGFAALTAVPGPWTDRPDRPDVADLADAVDQRLRQARTANSD